MSNFLYVVQFVNFKKKKQVGPVAQPGPFATNTTYSSLSVFNESMYLSPIHSRQLPI